MVCNDYCENAKEERYRFFPPQWIPNIQQCKHRGTSFNQFILFFLLFSSSIVIAFTAE